MEDTELHLWGIEGYDWYDISDIIPKIEQIIEFVTSGYSKQCYDEEWGVTALEELPWWGTDTLHEESGHSGWFTSDEAEVMFTEYMRAREGKRNDPLINRLHAHAWVRWALVRALREKYGPNCTGLELPYK